MTKIQNMYGSLNDGDVLYQTPPERHLLAAVLERAVRDLSPIIDFKTRRETIAWFYSTKKYNKKYKDCIQFVTIIQELALNEAQVAFLMEKVRTAQDVIPNAPFAKEDVPVPYRRRCLK